MFRRLTTLTLTVSVSFAGACKNDQDLVSDPDIEDFDSENVPCITVEPGSVNFGALEVNVDPAKSEVVTVRNACTADLTIYGLELADVSAPFAIGAIGTVMVPPGSSTEFFVTFDPMTSATWTTQVWIESNDPENATASVDITGEGIAPIISLDPLAYDFGVPYLGCELAQDFTISNVGNADLLVDDMSFASASPEFDFSTSFGLPLTVTPGDSIDVPLYYVGIDGFKDTGYFTVSSNDPWTPEAVATVTGSAESFGTNHEEFEQPIKSTTDILFVVDNSCSMSEEQANLTDNFEAFINILDAAESDYQLAVITTDKPKLRGDIITPATPDPFAEFQSQALVGTNGSADEQGLAMAYDATKTGGEAGPGSAFLRDNSTLSIVFLTDEPDSSKVKYSTMKPDDYVDAWLGLKGGDTDLVRVHAIAGEVPTPSCLAAAAGTGYDEAVALTGGEFVSICAKDWGINLESVAQGSITVHNSFVLTKSPVPETIEVTVDGSSLLVGWSYDLATNSVVFEADFIPDGGSTVELDYEVQAECGG